MKKIVVTFLLMVMLVTACASKEETEQKKTPNPIELESSNKKSDPDAEHHKKESEEILDDKDTKGEEENSDVNNEGKKQEISIYSANDNADGYKEEKDKINYLTPAIVLEKLVEKGVVSSETQVLDFTEKKDSEEKIIELDLSNAFNNTLTSQGSTGEDLTFHSVCNTYLKAYDADRIKITVEGKAPESGHQDFSGYFELNE